MQLAPQYQIGTAVHDELRGSTALFQMRKTRFLRGERSRSQTEEERENWQREKSVFHNVRQFIRGLSPERTANSYQQGNQPSEKASVGETLAGVEPPAPVALWKVGETGLRPIGQPTVALGLVYRDGVEFEGLGAHPVLAGFLSRGFPSLKCETWATQLYCSDLRHPLKFLLRDGWEGGPVRQFN